MALSDSYIQVYGQLPEFFQRLADGEAPDKFTSQLLKDWGYSSSNWRAVIPFLKSLGFLDANGTPSQRYHDYRNSALSRSVMWQALKEAYGDLFVLKSRPTDADKKLIQGKFKSAHNVSDPVAKLMASTFYAVYKLADPDSSPSTQETEGAKSPGSASQGSSPPLDVPDSTERQLKGPARPNLHYNIQIHLPSTKDLEVYNAIFRSLKEHLLE